MVRTPSAAIAVAVCALALAPPVSAGVTSRFAPQGRQGTLFVASDGADAIVVTCSGGFVLVNGLAPQTGPLRCLVANRIAVTGGPGDNRIDLAGIEPAQLDGVFRGVAAYAEVDAGAGDDDVTGPPSGLVTLDGGPGDDRLEGRSIDRYVFGAAESSEVDTIVELGQPTCAPDFFGSNQFGSTWWTVPWDALDFTALAAGDPVSVAGAAPAGILARHRNRTILRAPTVTGIAIEAIAGGAGDDVLAGACMVVGNAGEDRIAGTVEGDLALGGPGDDALAGAGGPDMLQGGAGADELQGDAGADTLAGGSGNDALAGGDDGDVYLFSPVDGPQSDAVDEHPAAGVDVLSFDFPSRRPVAVNLAAAAGVLATASGMTVTGAPGSGPNVEGAIGGAGGDRLVGHGGDNQFWSGGGTDLAIGAGGDDVYHVDWVASMPYGAYGYWEPTWGGPFERAGVPARSPYEVDEKPPSVLRIVERARGGRDTLDLAERFLRHSIGAGRLEGQLDEGVTVDLTARRLVEAAVIEVVAARPGASAHIEGVRGTTYDDRLIGNGAANVLEGRQGRDVVVGGRGHDTCLVHLREDALRGCERVRPADPDR